MSDPSCTIFYSWQSQLPNATNRGFIERALEGAARAVREDAAVDARPEVDKDTANVPGSPNIADVIRQKIDAAEVVICDVSIVQGLDGDGERARPTPNPNVLIELGYAMKSLGTTERLVLVMNTAHGGIDKLPFDLRQYRPTTYHLDEGATNDEKAAGTQGSRLEAGGDVSPRVEEAKPPRRNQTAHDHRALERDSGGGSQVRPPRVSTAEP